MDTREIIFEAKTSDKDSITEALTIMGAKNINVLTINEKMCGFRFDVEEQKLIDHFVKVATFIAKKKPKSRDHQ